MDARSLAVVSKMAFLANTPGVCFNRDELGGVIATGETEQWAWKEREKGGRGNEICLLLQRATDSHSRLLVSSDTSQMASPGVGEATCEVTVDAVVQPLGFFGPAGDTF